MDNCIFCKIISGDIPSRKVYEDDDTLAFDDINPQAAVHTIVIPKKHLSNIVELSCDSDDMMAKLIKSCVRVAEIKGIRETGFRTVNNCGENAGQTVMHVHMHVLGYSERNEKL